MNLSRIDMSPSSDDRGFASINAYARKVEIDNRISLHYYYRIADNLLRQAKIYREERNLIDLYIILLRFSSLLCETIPSHRDYHASLPKERTTFKKKLLDVLDELESLKPVVQKQFTERNRETQWDYLERVSYASSTTNSPSVRTQISTVPQHGQSGSAAVSPSAWKYSYERAQVASADKGQMTKRSSNSFLGLPYPKEETLSRHSILGPNGLSSQWNVPVTGVRVQYPTNFGLTKVEPSSNLHQVEQSTVEKEKEVTAVRDYASDMASVLSLDDGKWLQPAGDSSLSIDIMPQQFNQLSIRQPSPPPVVAQIHRPTGLVPIPPENVADPRPGPPVSSTHGVSDTKSFQHLHIPVKMMESFLRLAEKHTARNLETCGVLAGSLKKKVFCVTTLIIPKQEATSDSCQTLNEEEIFDYQDSRSLFPLGWIHTHPTQTCFMSSVDLHTHYSYQIMLPEAVAIVMAPTDETRTHGIFHLSDPGGVSVIRNCQQRGFHPHEEPSDGSPLYEHCSHVFMNPNLQFEVADLR